MSNEYQVLSERIYSDFPVFGSCIRQRAAVALSKDKSPYAVRILAEAVVRSSDRKVITIALEALRNLRDKKAIDTFCEIWLDKQSQQFKAIIKKCNYVPSDANTRALFYFLMGDWQKYEGLDIDQKLLANAYKSANKEIQDRVTAIARQAGRIELLKILVDSKHGFGFDKITDKNLSTLVDILVANPDRKEIWRFLYNASPVWSKKLLHRIKESSLENNFPADEKLILTRLFDLNQKFNLEEFKDSIFLYLNQIKSSSFMMPRPIHSLVILSDRETILLATTYEVIVWNLSKKQQLKRIDISYGFEHKNVTFNPQSQYTSGLHFTIYKAEIKTRGKYFGPYNYHYEVEESIYKSSLHSIEPSSSTSSDKFSLYLQDKFIDDDRYCLFGDEPIYWIDNDATETFNLTMAVSPNEKFLAVGGIANSYERKCFKPFVKVWSLSHNIVLNKFPHFNVASLAFSQDSKILASGSKDGSINLINIPYLETDEQFQSYRKCFQAHNSCISALAISPDNKILASSCKEDRYIRLWSIPDAESLNVITTSSSTTSLLITPDSKVLVVGMEDADIGLWSIDGNFLQVLKGHTASITSLAVTPDGKTLISGSKDKTIRLWNLKNPNDFPINELSDKDVAELSLKRKLPTLTEGVRNAIKFTLELIRLRQQFDIDIEDSSNNIASSEFDIEID
ncbi:MAG: hypothetical protein DCE90_18385 [Pseudanabaena sp.]|nr:MAG: hypothetical protein DCE90_18385 [Pseudanabaena sp.]